MEATDEHSEARKSRNRKWLVIGIGVLLLIGLSVYIFLRQGLAPLPPYVTRPPANDATASAAASVQTLIAQTQRADPDDDRDGLSTARELELGTDPDNPDTDGDELSDGDEVLIFGTNPLLRDTDGDGLTDGDEVNLHGTDPRNPDTDGDGVNDGTEVRLGTDPLLPPGTEAPTPTLIATAHPNDCSGSPSPTRVVRIPMTMRVVLNGVPNRFREQPDPAARMITQAPPGSLFSVIGGPVCDSTQFLRWYQVEWQGTTGWMVEGVGDSYYIEDPNAPPNPSITPSPTPFPIVTVNANDCTGSPPTRLQVGMTARVPIGGVPSRIREAPDPSARMITQVVPGGEFRIIGGPACDDTEFLRWWQVEWQSVTGWMAEGWGNSYYIEDPNAPPTPTASSQRKRRAPLAPGFCIFYTQLYDCRCGE